jgi:hypothetical protein
MDRFSGIVAAFARRGFETELFPSRLTAAMRLLEITRDRTVGYGGSVTLEALDVLDNIRAQVKALYTHLPGRAGDEERRALTADVFLTSANAVTADGCIVNIDGTGNRVAATCFGPGRVIYLVGSNKIVQTLDEAMLRAKEAAVRVATKYHRNTPCVTTGKCEDCLSPDCVCSVTTIHRKKPGGVCMSVFLIDEALGF